MEAMKYAYVVERGPTSWGAYVPDLPGCVAVAKSYVTVTRLIQEAAQFHVEGLVAAGLPVPKPKSRLDELEVSVPRRRGTNPRAFSALISEHFGKKSGRKRTRR
jgi:predicted RNase H-like HicB family nuclease